MKTLISLTSAQTLPNILFAKEQSDWDRYIFISTELMEEQHKTEHILQVLGIEPDNENVIIKEVIEDSLEDIAQKLSEIEFQDSEEITINLTGGTKVMAIGVYNFFIRKSCKVFYIPFPKNKIVQIFPEVKQKTSTLEYRINLEDYLKSYDVRINLLSLRQKNQTFPASITHQLYEHNKQHSFRQYWKALQNVGNELRSQPFIHLSESRFEQVKQGLELLNYQPKITGQLSEKEVKYFVGAWWEEYLYHFIKNKLQLSDTEIGLNIEINKDNAKRFSAGNEFDILFVYDNKFYVLECKTGIKYTDIQIFNDYAYKLAALRKFFGLGVKLSLCVLQKLDSNSAKKDFFADRSEVLNIKLFDGNNFNDMNDFLAELII
jgi:hypothetical protein